MIAWFPVFAPEIRGVDKVRRCENGVDEVTIEWPINSARNDGSLAFPHRRANAGKVETEIRDNNSSKPEKNLFGGSSHHV
jgi:hypothetical protein